MRTSLGNCDPIGGFCTSVNADICEALHKVADRPRGEWIFEPKDAIELMFTKPKCSECGFESADGGNFCSNCGADMGKGQTQIRQHGEWVEIENGVYICSFCKNQIEALIPPDYCPNCRADMRESDVE